MTAIARGNGCGKKQVQSGGKGKRAAKYNRFSREKFYLFFFAWLKGGGQNVKQFGEISVEKGWESVNRGRAYWHSEGAF